ncbi:MAG: 2-C-methyl-D-erythritol 2,4-cyclodiphosphate synthase [Gemmatimonadota bacterium]|nr:2-C-methyl-D-erythritol 2,4-cyclodiphosphate synthase [Gemmatimonadota bacterium]
MELSTPFRVGLGYDSHRFESGRPLILGGIKIPDHPGLAGHSDGDAIAHALIDAILGAVSLGNVGTHFPPTEERWKDADSTELLSNSVEVIDREGWMVVNVDLTVICESPQISLFAPEMKERLSDVLQVPLERISIKGKTNEGMGWIGESKGLAVHAVALLESR